jgi:hypothetical protein
MYQLIEKLGLHTLCHRHTQSTGNLPIPHSPRAFPKGRRSHRRPFPFHCDRRMEPRAARAVLQRATSAHRVNLEARRRSPLAAGFFTSAALAAKPASGARECWQGRFASRANSMCDRAIVGSSRRLSIALATYDWKYFISIAAKSYASHAMAASALARQSSSQRAGGRPKLSIWSSAASKAR